MDHLDSILSPEREMQNMQMCSYADPYHSKVLGITGATNMNQGSALMMDSVSFKSKHTYAALLIPLLHPSS